MKKGKLYICPTPIGNLEDITLRTIRILKEVDLVAAEDTRHTVKLLNHYDIKTSLISYHEHNLKERGIELIEKINNGFNIAQVSDAGMPGISDPGQDLINLAIKEDIEVIVLPGATASITALIASGLSTDQFIFKGFLSSKRSQRIRELEDIRDKKETIILYESPYRLLDTLNDMIDILGNRGIAIIRELTKLHEEVFRGNIEESIDKFSTDIIRGEFVLVVEGSKEDNKEIEIDIKRELQIYIEEGYSKKSSVKIVSEKYNLPKNEVYKESLDINL
ncbi:MAG TPA: 16S rRNA (cytidine(1402)-2'-O)-methyltransferase [Tissierellaceae bacterium]|nr:16S rRNA (cytidine(1402)-2'-O)-methyltransferase [Tissierellaceae bacterium]